MVDLKKIRESAGMTQEQLADKVGVVRQTISNIRFVDGNIILGEDGNQITLKIQNDRISFLENGVEVAYFANRKLYVNEVFAGACFRRLVNECYLGAGCA